MSFDTKRAEVVSKMLFKMYDDDLDESFLSKKGLYFVFKNKPDQSIKADFALFDTWDKIKSKMDKLVKSDGVCVVCCEPEILPLQKAVFINDGKKSYKYQRPVSHICETCCEFTCMSCIKGMSDNGVDTKITHKCPVCRTCLLEYTHKLTGEQCKWC